MKHRFILVIPVADRPRHIQACLSSLTELLRRFPPPRKLQVLLADDSADAAQIAANREIAQRFSTPQFQVIHLGHEEQWALSAPLQASLPGVVGTKPHDEFGHKGQGVMRNIAYLKVAQMLNGEPSDVLIWSLDSDQEFCVNLADGRIDYCVDYFGDLDAIFARTDAQVLTGKVVGDPPVSPAVMTANFLADIEGFLAGLALQQAMAPCSHHGQSQNMGNAAYHDMADLFGFRPDARHAYPCPLTDAHSEADCFAHLAGRVNSFFYGEHPTRLSSYAPAELFSTVQPARTVYAGNYVFRPAALKYFIPFANLRLRMSGPTLGRILKAELGPHFISANLPMLHKRTVESGGQAEFRPGIETRDEIIDMSGEFERQFYGDVMLFTTERFSGRLASTDFALLDEVREEMLAKYNARQQSILVRLAGIETLLNDPVRWWHGQPATAHFRHFCANVRRNFGADSSGHAHINDATRWQAWRADLLTAIERYPAERTAWEQALCVR